MAVYRDIDSNVRIGGSLTLPTGSLTLGSGTLNLDGNNLVFPNSHSLNKIVLWSSAHHIGTEPYHMIIGGMSGYGSSVGHKFYRGGGELIAQIGYGGSGTPTNRLDSYFAGNVGIGDTSPGYGVDIYKATGYNHLRVRGDTPLIKLSPTAYNSGNGAEIWQNASGDVRFNVNSSTTAFAAYSGGNFAILSPGNVGIGVTSPSYKLDINGAMRATSLTTSTESYMSRGAYTDPHSGVGYALKVSGGIATNHLYVRESTMDFSVHGDNIRLLRTGTGAQYPYIQWTDVDGHRGAYLGWGSKGSYIDFRLDHAKTLALRGGNLGIGVANASYGIHQFGGGHRLQALFNPTAPTVTVVGAKGTPAVAEVSSLQITGTVTTDGNVSVTLDGAGTVSVAVDNGTAEVATLDLSGTVTTAGDVTVTLDGISTNVAVALNDTASMVADKIKATTFTGWTLSGTSPQVIFTSNTTGVRTDATFSVGTSAGVTGTMATTVQGVNADTAVMVADKIRATAFTGWTTGGTAGTDTVTFTANVTGAKVDGTYSAGTTGATGTMTVATQGKADTRTTYNYKVVAIDGNNNRTLLSPSGGVTDGYPTLDTTNYNTVSWATVSGAVKYLVFRNSDTGYIAEVTGTSVNDTGQALLNAGSTTRNATADMTIDGQLHANDLFAHNNQLFFDRGDQATIHRVGRINFDWTSNGAYNSENHGLFSLNYAGVLADSMRLNSYNDVTITLDSNNNNGDSYLRIKHHGLGDDEDLFRAHSPSGNVYAKGTVSAGNEVKVSGSSPQLLLQDTDNTGAGKNYWLHNNSGRLYFLQDSNGDGTWDGTHPGWIEPDKTWHFNTHVKLNSDATLTGHFYIKGNSILLDRPNTTGGWARGLHWRTTDGITTTGGVGMYGSSTTINNIYFAHGSSPWSSGLGVYVLPGGTVGIGNASPNTAYKLDVSGSVNAVSLINVQPASGATTEGGEIQLTGAGTYANKIIDNYYGRFRVHNGTTNLFTIMDNGDVGIGLGNAAPTQKLEIDGNIKIPSGGEIHSGYNNSYIIKDHASGEVTISAAGSSLYLGYQNTASIKLWTSLYGGGTAASTIIIGTDGTLYYRGEDADTRYVNTIGDTMTGHLRIVKSGNPIGLQKEAAGTGNLWLNFRDELGGEIGWVGFGSASNNHFSIRNAISGANLQLLTNGTGIVTINGNTAWHSGNDGSGSGLDADKLDGIDSTGFQRLSQDHLTVVSTGSWHRIARSTSPNGRGSALVVISTTGGATAPFNTSFIVDTDWGTGGTITILHNPTGSNVKNIRVVDEGLANEVFIDVDFASASSNYAVDVRIVPFYGTWTQFFGAIGTVTLHFSQAVNVGGTFGDLRVGVNKVWHEGNDGSGSGLDADKIDGIDSYNILQTDGGETDTAIDVNTVQGTYLYLKSNKWTNKGPTGHNGTGFLTMRTHSGDYHSQLWFDTNGDDFYHRTRNAGTIRPWRKVFHEGNLNPVRVGNSDQNVGTNFIVNGRLWLGSGAIGNIGDVILRSGSSQNVIITSDSSSTITTAKTYIYGDGNAKFSGTVTSNAIAVTSTGLVANLNADKLDGYEAVEIAKNESILNANGYGVYHGCEIRQLNPIGNDARVMAGIVYTDSGRRVEITEHDVNLPDADANGYDRIDVIYVRGKEGGPANEGSVKWIDGKVNKTTPTDPPEPAIPTGAVRLAKVYRPAGSSNIADKYDSANYSLAGNSKIYDERNWQGSRYYETDGETNTALNAYAYERKGTHIDNDLRVWGSIREGGSLLTNKYAALSGGNTISGTQQINGRTTIQTTGTLGGAVTGSDYGLRISDGSNYIAMDSNEILGTTNIHMKSAQSTGNYIELNTNFQVDHDGHVTAKKNATTVTIAAGQTSVRWTHNYGATTYAINLASNSFARHVKWFNKTANYIDVVLDDAHDEDILVDCIIIGY